MGVEYIQDIRMFITRVKEAKQAQEYQASSDGGMKCTHLERLGMDDRNVALSEQAMINAPETTDYDENTMVDVEVMSEKPASLSETWHSTSSTTPPSAATAQCECTQPVDNYKLESSSYFHPLITFCWHLLG